MYSVIMFSTSDEVLSNSVYKNICRCLSKDEQVISDSDSMQVLLVVAKVGM